MNPIEDRVSVEPLIWSDRLLLGFAPMDDLHREFVDVVRALQVQPNTAMGKCLNELEIHLKIHFENEDHWMLSTEFPARECHMDEHAKVLLSVMQVKQRLLEGDFDICRRLADELARWFPGHADYLDSALSHWLCSKKFGAKPLVFRRHLDADFRKVDDHG